MKVLSGCGPWVRSLKHEVLLNNNQGVWVNNDFSCESDRKGVLMHYVGEIRGF